MLVFFFFLAGKLNEHARACLVMQITNFLLFVDRKKMTCSVFQNTIFLQLMNTQQSNRSVVLRRQILEKKPHDFRRASLIEVNRLPS